VARKRDKEREALEAEAARLREEGVALHKAVERVHLEAQVLNLLALAVQKSNAHTRSVSISEVPPVQLAQRFS
jgi:hypothetical protein